jgi:S1-C subfamily serine protease
MTTPAPVPSRSRLRGSALAVAVLALGVTGVLLASQGLVGAQPVNPPHGTVQSTAAGAGSPAVVRSTSGAAPSAAAPARPVKAVRPVRSARPARQAGVGGAAGPSAAELRTVAAGLVDVDTVLDGGRARGAGTGIVLSPDGTVLTNDHVVAGASTIAVTDLGNGRTYRGLVVGADPADDVAVVRAVGATGLAVAPLSSGSGPRVGAPVVGIGNAGGVGEPSAAPGVVTALGRRITAHDEGAGAGRETLTGLIATTAGLQPGDSGGALVDGSGRVVGVDTAAAADASSGFAIPIARALAVAHRIA